MEVSEAIELPTIAEAVMYLYQAVDEGTKENVQQGLKKLIKAAHAEGLNTDLVLEILYKEEVESHPEDIRDWVDEQFAELGGS